MSELSRQHDDLINQMAETKAKWDRDAEANSDSEDETDNILNQAIEAAIAQGKGWKAGEKEEYMAKICDDDNLPPLFATTQEDLEKSGMADAFSSLIYEGESPTSLMLSLKQKGNDAFMNGKRNVAKNVQYYRDAINKYYEAFAWAEKIESYDSEAQYPPYEERKTDDPFYTHDELKAIKSTLFANAAMAHLQLRNWGYVREDSKKALVFNEKNVKAWYRLAKAHEGLRKWEECGDAIERGLEYCRDGEDKELKRLQKLLDKKIRAARLQRQKRERARAERVSHVKNVWKWCKKHGIRLGRVPLVASVTDEEEADDVDEFRWHHHHPHTGKLPQLVTDDKFAWPSMFVYPAHGQSDFVEHFAEDEMIAMQMVEIFPELEDDEKETTMPWDFNNEYVCSNLAVYFEVHEYDYDENSEILVHPEQVQPLKDQKDAMRFYESSRALKGDEGPEMANLFRAMERKRLHLQRKAWKKKYGSLWAKPDLCPIIQVHPAATLKDVLTHKAMLVPSVSHLMNSILKSFLWHLISYSSLYF